MPVKWTPETDQILLLKILETSQLNADVKAIADAWPDGYEKPTPRAITERLVKIRQNAKTKGAANHFSVSGAKKASNNSTPRQRNKVKATVNGAGVHKNTPTKTGNVGRGLAEVIKLESDDDDEVDNDNASSVSDHTLKPAVPATPNNTKRKYPPPLTPDSSSSHRVANSQNNYATNNIKYPDHTLPSPSSSVKIEHHDEVEERSDENHMDNGMQMSGSYAYVQDWDEEENLGV